MDIYFEEKKLAGLDLYGWMTSPFIRIGRGRKPIADLIFLPDWNDGIKVGDEVHIFSDILESGKIEIFKQHDIRVAAFVRFTWNSNARTPGLGVELPGICIIEAGYAEKLKNIDPEKIREYIQPENDWRILDDICRVDHRKTFGSSGKKIAIRIISKIRENAGGQNEQNN